MDIHVRCPGLFLSEQNLKTFIHIIHNFIHIFLPSPLWITCAKLSLHNFNTSFRKNPLKYNTFRHFSTKQVDNNDSRKVFLPIIHIIHTNCFHTSHNTSSGISPEILPSHLHLADFVRRQKTAPWPCGNFPKSIHLLKNLCYTGGVTTSAPLRIPPPRAGSTNTCGF